MNILAVSGSIRNGNTDFLVNETIKQIKTYKDANVTKIHLKNTSIHFCNGCLSCDMTGKCCFDDDMNEIISIVREADALILATPTRWGLLSGELKTFLDRLNPLAINEELKGKKAIVIAVGQSDEENRSSIDDAAESIKMFCNSADIIVVDTVIVCNCYDENDASKSNNAISSCSKAVKQLFVDI